jgi:hypothetical protein
MTNASWRHFNVYFRKAKEKFCIVRKKVIEPPEQLIITQPSAYSEDWSKAQGYKFVKVYSDYYHALLQWFCGRETVLFSGYVLSVHPIMELSSQDRSLLKEVDFYTDLYNQDTDQYSYSLLRGIPATYWLYDYLLCVIRTRNDEFNRESLVPINFCQLLRRSTHTRDMFLSFLEQEFEHSITRAPFRRKQISPLFFFEDEKYIPKVELNYIPIKKYMTHRCPRSNIPRASYSWTMANMHLPYLKNLFFSNTGTPWNPRADELLYM